MEDQSGILFDPELVPVFIGMLNQDVSLSASYPDPEMIIE
jgi:hypothetical protein